MTVRATSSVLLADAWALWRADWQLLTAIMGLFALVPDMARRLLLLPDLQRAIASVEKPDLLAQLQIQSDWTAAYLPWLLLASILTHFGTFTVFALYLDRDRVDVRGAILRALRSLLPYVVAMVIVSVISGLGLLLLVIGYFYFSARLALVGPVIAAERGTNPLAAIGRSVRLTRGHDWTLTALVIVVTCAGVVAQMPFSVIDAWMATNAPNPIALAIVDAAGAVAATLGVIAMALVQVAAYRRLSST